MIHSSLLGPFAGTLAESVMSSKFLKVKAAVVGHCASRLIFSPVATHDLTVLVKFQ